VKLPQRRSSPEDSTRVGDPEHGAGVSVNKYFKNVNWVATAFLMAMVVTGVLADAQAATLGRTSTACSRTCRARLAPARHRGLARSLADGRGGA
jgi:hypothetical protein